MINWMVRIGLEDKHLDGGIGCYETPSAKN
jgi:hypothetical protein